MERDRLAIAGTENPGDSTRIELVLDAAGELDLLHAPDGGGRYARVIRAVVAGRFPRPVAFKLERDTIPAHEGAVKFVSEYQAQRRAHQDLKGDRTRVVRAIEVSPLPPGRDCDELPPTLICPRSRLVLAPRCPCGRNDIPSGLTCPACRRRRTEEEVLASSACPGCVSAGAACKAFWLNRRTCKLLVLELLDLNLEEYVAWRWSPPAGPPPNRPAWQKFEEHLAAGTERERRLGLISDRVTKEFDELRFLLDLFSDAVQGVRELHEKSIAHLDLKPANLCLALEGASARLKVIDLGQAHGPNTPWPVWFQSVSADAGSGTPGGQFLAPEQERERFVPIDVRWRKSADLHYLVIPPEAPVPASVLGGDLYCFPSDRNEPFLRVIRGSPTAAGYEIRAASVERGPAREGRGPTVPDQLVSEGCLIHQADFSADLFALGMLLAYLVTRGKVDLGPTRAALDELQAFLKSELAKEPPLPARSAVHILSHLPNRALAEPWQRFLQSLPNDRQLREVTRELLGMALRAIVRGVPGFSYAQDRSADRSCLNEFRADLQTIRNRLVIHFQSHDLHDGRVARLRRSGLARLREWLREQKVSGTESEPPPYDRELICFTLDMLAGNGEHCEREFRLLRKHYRTAPRQLAKDLDLFEKELDAHLVCARHIHPVVLGLFEVVSPPRGRKRESPEVAEWKSCQDRAAQLLLSLRAYLSRFDNKDSRAYLVEADITEVRNALDACAELLARLESASKYLTEWQTEFYRSQYQKTTGWDRLDFSGMEEWHKFGKRCWMLLSGEVKQARRWSANSCQFGQVLARLSDSARAELVDPWPATKRAQAWTLRGIGVRLLAFLFRREPTTRVHLPADRSARLNECLTETERWLRATRSVPFAGRLAAASPSPRPDQPRTL